MSEKIIVGKKLVNTCPVCDNSDHDSIEWGDKEWQDETCYQDCTCQVCGTEFREFYEYCETEWEILSTEPVPEGVRVKN